MNVDSHYVAEIVNPTAIATVRRHVCVHCGEVIGPRWLAEHLYRNHADLLRGDSDA